MLNVMHYIFSSFWIWLGTVILVLAVSRIRLVNVVTRSLVKNNSPEDDHSNVDNHNE